LLAVLFFMLTECLQGDDDEDESESSGEYKNVKPMKDSLHDDDETTEYVPQKPKPVSNGANFLAPGMQRYTQSGNGSSQRNGYSQPSTSTGSNYKQPGVNYQQPGNLNPALRKRNVATSVQAPNGQPYPAGGYSQAPGYRQQSIGNRPQNV